MSTLLPDSKGQTLKGATILRLPSGIFECQSWWKGEVILKKDDNREAVGGIEGGRLCQKFLLLFHIDFFTKILHIDGIFFVLELKTADLLKSAWYLMKSQCLVHVIQIQIKDWWHFNVFYRRHIDGDSWVTNKLHMWKQTVLEHIALPSRGCFQKLNTMA